MRWGAASWAATSPASPRSQPLHRSKTSPRRRLRNNVRAAAERPLLGAPAGILAALVFLGLCVRGSHVHGDLLLSRASRSRRLRGAAAWPVVARAQQGGDEVIE